MRLASVVDPATGHVCPITVLPDERRLSFQEVIPGGHTMPFARSVRDAVEHLSELKRGLRSWGRGSNTSLIGSNWSLLPPVTDPRTFRDFYAFEQHVATCRKRRGLEMIPAWYERPAFYFSNPTSLVGHEAPV